jgi:hypothetical protein
MKCLRYRCEAAMREGEAIHNYGSTSMIRKSGNRFSEKIMLQQEDRAE